MFKKVYLITELIGRWALQNRQNKCAFLNKIKYSKYVWDINVKVEGQIFLTENKWRTKKTPKNCDPKKYFLYILDSFFMFASMKYAFNIFFAKLFGFNMKNTLKNEFHLFQKSKFICKAVFNKSKPLPVYVSFSLCFINILVNATVISHVSVVSSAAESHQKLPIGLT